MAITLLASQCPPIPTPAALLSIADAGELPGGNSPVAENITAGQTSPWTPIQRRNATRQDLTGRHGGGGYAIATGLSLIAPASGLLLSISSGLAMIDGPVENESTASLPLPNNAARAWIWFLQNATPTYTLQNGLMIPVPPGACALLGSCVTVANNITQVDTSGVLYLKGGNLWRQTADVGAPGDTPSSSLNFFTRTQGGLFYWDGVAYAQVDASVAASAALLGAATQDDLDTTDRKFRALLLSLVNLLGAQILLTDELAADLELAASEI